MRDFPDRNEADLRTNHQNGLMYSRVDDKRDAVEMTGRFDRVRSLRDRTAEGDL